MRSGIAKLLVFFLLIAVGNGFPTGVIAQQEPEDAAAVAVSPGQVLRKLTIGRVMMCEKVENLSPTGQAIVFPVSLGQVYCFTSFDVVPQPMVIYHRWFHHDELNTQTRLRLYPPKWATYSVIQLRETDKGPWRVEVSDENGRVFEVLRFSITD
ncbi:MAG: DUF2914 domain-containing protein [Syntrophobacteraceae bacterium]